RATGRAARGHPSAPARVLRARGRGRCEQPARRERRRRSRLALPDPSMASTVLRTPSRNGHEADSPPRPVTAGPATLVMRIARGLANQVQKRIPRADLDERDPDYIREQLPWMWMLASVWFRGEVRGLGNIPDEGPVLLVGNHSGGNLTPDTTLFT